MNIAVVNNVLCYFTGISAPALFTTKVAALPSWFRFFYHYFREAGLKVNEAKLWNAVVLGVLLIILVLLIDYLIWKVLRIISIKMARGTKSNFDNLAIKNKLPRNVAHIPSLWLSFQLVPTVFHDFGDFQNLAIKFLQILTIVVILRIIRSLLDTLNAYLKTRPRYRDKPIDSYIQVFMIFAWIAGTLGILAVLTGVKITSFLTGLGAASAVVLLVFRDSILGFVASIQVSMNDMVRIGDWITMDKYGADGNVIEISLVTVKVQNFDYTTSTIPTYALISESFKNWRTMQVSGGRRIKRAVRIRQTSVRFLEAKDLERLQQISLIAPYLKTRQDNIDQFNQDRKIDKTLPLNGRNQTNLGVFRKYLETYLNNYPATNKNMTLMARYLEPTPQGLPVEIYAFSSDKRWENYEHIMADILDHVLAAIPYFGLEIYELPTSLVSEA